MSPIDRIMPRVDQSAGPDACWFWNGAKGGRDRRPAISVGGKMSYVSRLLLAHSLGRELRPGEMALHCCDHPWCVNPAHIRLGDAASNMRDKIAKGRARYARGEAHGQCKLSAAHVRRIRVDRRPLRVVASEFGISVRQTSNIRSLRSQGHVEQYPVRDRRPPTRRRAAWLTAPAGAQFLVMKASVAGFNARVGDHASAGMPGAEYPTVSVTDGSAGWHIDTNETLRLPAQTVTVKGCLSASVLAYHWL